MSVREPGWPSGPSLVNTVISRGVVVAILNAVIAIVLSYARIFFSSGGDRAWPGPVNSWMTAVGRFKSRWFPTALVAVLGAWNLWQAAIDEEHPT